MFGMCGSCPSLAGSMERGELSGRIGLGSEVELEEEAACREGRGRRCSAGAFGLAHSAHLTNS